MWTWARTAKYHGWFGLEFAGPLDVGERLVVALAVGEDERALPQRPGVAVALLQHVENGAVGVGVRVAGEELGAELQQRVVVREPLAGLGEVGARRGAAVGLGQESGERAVRLRESGSSFTTSR